MIAIIFLNKKETVSQFLHLFVTNLDCISHLFDIMAEKEHFPNFLNMHSFEFYLDL